jgi:zinc protease
MIGRAGLDGVARLLVLCVTMLSLAAPAAAKTPAAKGPPGRPSASRQAAARPAASVQGPLATVEGVSEYRLANGLKILLLPDPSKATFTVNITYLVGSLYEGYGESGMAHLLEHLMFKGTPRHPRVPAEMSARGASSNGATSYDETYYVETLAATGDNLDWAIGLEADRMVNSFIARRDLDSEMTVVRNEFESGENDPGGILVQRMGSTAYLFHNYGKPTIGTRSDIEQVSIDNLQAFYRRYYQPDNAVLSISGHFDTREALNLVARHFGAIPKPKRSLSAPYTVEPTQDGERTVVLRRVGEIQIAAVAYHVPSGPDADYPAVDLVAQILGDDSPAGRLHQALVQTGRAARVFAWDLQLRDPGLVYFGAEVPKDGDLDGVASALQRVVEGFAETPPTDAEVARAKASIESQLDRMMGDSDRLVGALPQWIGMGDWRLLFLYRDRLHETTADDVRRVAQHYLKSSNRTAGRYLPTPAPDRAEIPPRPEIDELVSRYKGRAEVDAGEVFDPTPENIEARTHRVTLDNGMRVALLPKRTRGATVNVSMTLRFATLDMLRGHEPESELTAAMLMRGTAKHTRQEIQDRLDALKSRVNLSGSGGTVSVGIESTRDNLPEVMRLVAEVLREPSFPERELTQMKQSLRADIEQQTSEPQSVAMLALRRHLNPYPQDDPRYAATPAEKIAAYESTGVPALRAFHDTFYGASDGRLAAVGDFDADALQGLLGELFGQWKSPQPYERIPHAYADTGPLDERIEIRDKANAVLFGAVNLPLKDEDPSFPALVLADYMMGGGFLNSRLATRVRQKDGLSYSVGSDLDASSRDELATFSVYAIFAPQNLDKLRRAVKEELSRAHSAGFSEAEVQAARSGLLAGLKVHRAQDASVAVQLAHYLDIDRTLAWDARIERRIGQLTAAEVSAAFRRHIDPGRLAIVQAGDFKPAK